MEKKNQGKKLMYLVEKLSDNSKMKVKVKTINYQLFRLSTVYIKELF